MRRNHSTELPSRREMVRLFTAASAATALAGSASFFDSLEAAQVAPAQPRCVVVPKQTEGPYFVDERLRRGDIRQDPANGAVKAGVPLTLAINLTAIEHGKCAPLAGAMVDVWQCDAEGEYAGVLDRGRRFDTRGQKFLRGYELTDRDGRVEFTTIYPGWYPGRTVHVHFKVRTNSGNGRAGEFTSQWYFDDAMTDEVFKSGPYAAKGARPIRNDRDGIYRRGGSELMLNVSRTAEGYAGTFDLGIQL